MSLFFSALSTLILVISILIEDLMVFLKEVTESVSSFLFLLLNSFYFFFDTLYSGLYSICNNIISILDNVISNLNAFINLVIICAQRCGELFSLIGHSLILLVNLLPRTLYLLGLGAFNLLKVTKDSVITQTCLAYQSLLNMSPEMMLGIVSTVVVTGVSVKFTLRQIRERNITWRSVLHSCLCFICSVYIGIFESIVKCLRLTVTLMEMTVSNLRVPMFAHAGDSEDDEEDRENLVGDVEDSDDEENERRETRRRNYLLLLERAQNRKGINCIFLNFSNFLIKFYRIIDNFVHMFRLWMFYELFSGSDGGGSSRDDVEDELLREVERGREDKLCCICQDMEKCIMMLPCRHLCICERCQHLLRNHGNSCPMCRKQVKQMIKAYL